MPKTMSIQSQIPGDFVGPMFENFSMQDIVLLISAIGLARLHVHEEYRRMFTNLAGKVLSLKPSVTQGSIATSAEVPESVSGARDCSDIVSMSLLQAGGAIDGRVSIVVEDADGRYVDEVVVESPRLRFNGNWQVCSGTDDTPVVGDINQIRAVEIMERSKD